MSSYHDVYVETPDIPRTSIFNLPYGYELCCIRTGGWTLWRDDTQVAGEYGDTPLRIDIGGIIILDSFPKENE